MFENWHIFHDWEKWEVYKGRGKIYDFLETRQHRKCKICGKTQDISIIKT